MADDEEVEVKVADEPTELARIKDVETEVKALVSRSSGVQALKAVLAALPTTSKEDVTRKIAADAFVYAIGAVDKSAMDTVINELDQDQRAVLLKYTYKGMETADKKGCENLLAWHTKLVAIDGVGLIMRAMAGVRA